MVVVAARGLQLHLGGGIKASELVKVGMDLRSGLQLARGVDTSGFTAQARAMAGEGRWG